MGLEQVAVITSAHGLNGEIYLISYVSDYLSLKYYSPLTDKEKEYYITSIRPHGKKIIAKIKNINSRTEAELLKNTPLFTDKSKFPSLNSEEFFSNDLKNMKVILEDETEYGTIKDCYNFGAGEIVEITLRDSSKTILLPFNKDCFPTINKANKIATLILPKII